MEPIKEIIESRKEYLLQLKKETEKKLKRTPEGTLRICSRGDKAQYYHRTDPKDFNGVYIREKEISLIKQS